ncbi:MAG: DUF3160 domain-containing protein [Polyangiaceae bacterium]
MPQSLREALERASTMDRAGISEAYPAPATSSLSYDPGTATGLDTIQKSTLGLNENELATLTKHGFVISKRQAFPSFAYGYKSIYVEDLPVYVSADSILEAVHRTFNRLLKRTEETVLVDELTRMLAGMRKNTLGSSLDANTKKDADLYLTVAESLIRGSVVQPTAGGDSKSVTELFELTTAASGTKSVTLFGVTRDEDFSQFKPRGHYADSEGLQRYFRAMMWLGRVDLRLIETQRDGSQFFYRRQFDAAVALRELLGPEEFELWAGIDGVIGAFVGEHDSMTPRALDDMLTALGVHGFSESKALSDQRIIEEIAKGGWGAQRIASRIIYVDSVSDKALPLDRSFLLFGQRYTVDSHAFVNVTYDRVAKRMMPKPLDAAFAALGNNAALPLLSAEFDNASYVQGLAKTRALVDAHESSYWEGSLYTRWLSTLRALSPSADQELPAFAKAPLWQNRILATQLGSWAQLRHDTILYVKQSYSSGASCEFPDAYVDPYPEFYAKLGNLADAVAEVTETLPSTAAELKSQALAWAKNFRAVTTNLQQMAEDQRTGTAHSPELLAFINDAVKWDESSMCGGTTYSNLSGWYLKLYWDPFAGLEFAPVVADVHTQPTDEWGNDVGRILHVGVGDPRLMVVTVDTCNGPRAYAGLAYSYGELVTENWQRLNDLDWASEIRTKPFPDATWMSEVIAE